MSSSTRRDAVAGQLDLLLLQGFLDQRADLGRLVAMGQRNDENLFFGLLGRPQLLRTSRYSWRQGPTRSPRKSITTTLPAGSGRVTVLVSASPSKRVIVKSVPSREADWLFDSYFGRSAEGKAVASILRKPCGGSNAKASSAAGLRIRPAVHQVSILTSSCTGLLAAAFGSKVRSIVATACSRIDQQEERQAAIGGDLEDPAWLATNVPGRRRDSTGSPRSRMP